MALRLKPGDSLAWGAVDDSGDLTGTDIEAALKHGDFYFPLTVTPDDLTIGEFTVSAGDTSKFPVGWLDCDIKYTVAGVTRRTHTFRLFVDEKVTK
jgi:hypothetical protein